MRCFDKVIAKVKDIRDLFLPTSESPLVFELMVAGDNIINEAWESKETGNILYNQHDAYGYAVYFDGKEIAGARGYLDTELSKEGAEYSETVTIKGRDAVNDFLDGYEAPTGDIFTLVTVNAMWYSEEQELGLTKSRAEYAILSQTFYRLDELKNTIEKKYGAKLQQS